MLMTVLKRLAQGGRYSNKSVARELGIEEAMVEHMIEQLQRLGYIEKEDMGGCPSGCDCCSSKSSCCDGHTVEMNVWKITEKGKRFI